MSSRVLKYKEPVGIDPSKKDSLLKLCKDDLIPMEHHKFFNDLPEKDNEDDEDEDLEDSDGNE